MTVRFASVDKRALLAATLDKLAATMAQMAESARASAEAATHPEARPEDPKDMRSTETSYLARGQAMRVEELAEQIQRLRFFDPPAFAADAEVAAGALVELEAEDDDTSKVFFVLPYGGGIELTHAGERVTVITGNSPLGAALLGRSVGDEVELRVQGKKREYAITAIG